MNSIDRFDQRAENYDRYRPHYPKEIIPFLTQNIDLTKQTIIADVGSGTGISAELFIENGNTVYAVEPNKDMRETAQRIFQEKKTYISINGTAEATTLPDKSIDLILAGQAFHWFDKKKAKSEFTRIAAPGASLVLIWNYRKLDSPFQKAYEAMVVEFGKDYHEATQRNIDDMTMSMFFSPFTYIKHSISNAQYFDFEGFKGRYLSCSYAPLETDTNYQPMLKKLRQIFDSFKVDNNIVFEYSCDLYYGTIKTQNSG